MPKLLYKRGDIVRCTAGTIRGEHFVMKRGMLGVVYQYQTSKNGKLAVNVVEVVVPKDDKLGHYFAYETDLVAHDDARRQNRPIRLFVWNGNDVLKEITGGIAFALAYNVEQARRLILSDYPGIIGDSESAFLLNEPGIYARPAGFTQRGGM